MKKILSLVLLFGASSLSAGAYIDSQFMTSEQALMNSGYSQEAARIINIAKVDPYSPAEELDERSFFERFYNYIDPAKGAESTFPRHNIRYDSSWRDY